MQGTTALLRMGAGTLVLALVSVMLVILGCTGEQASPSSPSAGAAAVAAVAPTAANQAAQQKTVLVATAGQAQTTCIPGRGKARLETDAVTPSPVLMQPSPSSAVDALPHGPSGGTTSATLQGRIPSSPTHLDLGIVRT